MTTTRCARSRQAPGLVALVGYAACIVLANWFIHHVGAQHAPNGPHVIPVGFGYDAPSGVLWIGLALVLRDLVQATLGERAVALAIGAGTLLSYAVAPALAWASAGAFVASEMLDFAVYTPLARRGRVIAAVLLSNSVGLIVDTFVFLSIAFGSFEFWRGQVIGKAWLTVLALALIVPLRTRSRMQLSVPDAM